MDSTTLLLIALALSLDSLAVAIPAGLTIRGPRAGKALRVAAMFGAFHAVMPTIGWALGGGLKAAISGVDHWIAFGILAAIGGKMIYEAMLMGEDRIPTDPFRVRILLVLGVATSIDALAVGMSFAFLGIAIVTPAILIGSVIFVVSLLGVYIGNRVGHFFERKVEIAGGIILVAIGARILAEHLL